MQSSLLSGGHPSVDASTIARYVESPFGVYCDFFAPTEERDPLTLYQNLLFDRGQDHELTVMEENYPEAIEEVYETLEMMAEGAQSISDMPLIWLPGGMLGRPDVIIRVDGGPSHFGSYHYEVVEIKLAKNIRKAHMVQAAFYIRLLGYVQGFSSTTFHIVNGEGQLYSFNQSDHEQALDEAVQGVRAILVGEVVESCYGSSPWPWENYGDRLAIDKGDVSLIAGVGPSRQASLKSTGFTTVDDVVEATPEELTRVKGIGKPTADDFYTKAKAIVSQKPVRRSGALSLPEVKHC